MVTLRSFGTHHGSFHADEVTACALLLLYGLIDRDKIVRTRDAAVLDKLEYVCDVGGMFDPKIKRFDHHQQEYQGQMSSAGMVLDYLHQEGFIDANMRHYFKDELIDGVDQIDNGLVNPIPGHATFSSVIASFVPAPYDVSEEEMGKAFEEALGFTFSFLQRLKCKYEYIHGCKSDIQAQMGKNLDYLYFDRAMPWMNLFFELDGEHHPARFVIMPSGNHWKLRGIPPTYQERMQVRKPFPKAWAGLSDKELQKVTGIPGAIFCHKGLFFSVWETKEDAFRAYDLVK